MTETLTACFSATGNTAGVAHIISEVAGSDYFEIIPAQPYTPEDLNWNNPQSRTSIEMKETGNYPEIADTVSNMDKYKTIFLGFPIWWYAAPHIVLNFLNFYDFTNKIIFPFVTSGSSGLGKIPQILEQACPKAHWEAGERFSEHPSRHEIEKWAKAHISRKNQG